MSVGPLEPQFYAELVRLLELDLPDRDDPANFPAIREALTARFKERTQAEWSALFDGTEACVAPVVPLADAPHHPHLAARGTFVERDGITQPAPAPRFSRTACDPRHRARRTRRPHPRGAHRLGHRRRRRAPGQRRGRAGRAGGLSAMRPFLFLGTRAEDDVAQQEYDAVLAGTGLRPDELVRVRLEASPLGWIELDDLSGIILGGGPFNVSDPDEAKSAVQRRVEAELDDLAIRVVEPDFPFLGACYGIGVLGTLDGGIVDRTYGEPIGALPVRLSAEGAEDPLFGALPEVFDAYLGHKEAVSRLPGSAVLLASTDTCPVHAFRIGRNVYATQFHPELDAVAICDRIDAYSAHGYYEPHEQESLKAAAREAMVTEPVRLLARFVELHARP